MLACILRSFTPGGWGLGMCLTQTQRSRDIPYLNTSSQSKACLEAEEAYKGQVARHDRQRDVLDEGGQTELPCAASLVSA